MGSSTSVGGASTDGCGVRWIVESDGLRHEREHAKSFRTGGEFAVKRGKLRPFLARDWLPMPSDDDRLAALARSMNFVR